MLVKITGPDHGEQMIVVEKICIVAKDPKMIGGAVLFLEGLPPVQVAVAGDLGRVMAAMEKCHRAPLLVGAPNGEDG